jgi:hypothetical protein
VVVRGPIGSFQLIVERRDRAEGFRLSPTEHRLDAALGLPAGERHVDAHLHKEPDSLAGEGHVNAAQGLVAAE